MSNIEVEWKPEVESPDTTEVRDIPEGTVFTGEIERWSSRVFLRVSKDQVTSLDGPHAGAITVRPIRNYHPVNIRIVVDAEKPE